MDEQNGVWLREDHPRAVSLGYLHTWIIAVELQTARVGETTQGRGRFAEASLYLVAVRQLLRAVQLSQDSCLTTAARDAIAAALTEFAAVTPELSQARDMVEHFDDYERQVGRKKLPTPDVGRDTFEKQFVSDDPDQVRVGPVTISISAATSAARLLYDRACQALREDSDTVPLDVPWRARSDGK